MKWISIKKQKPPKNKALIGLDKNTNVEFHGTYDGLTFWRTITSEKELRTDFELTHWKEYEKEIYIGNRFLKVH